MTPVLGTTGGSAMWYLARGSGLVTMLLLTVSVLLGIVTSFRWSSERWPRFVIEFVHRNASLLVLVFLAIHVAAVLADAFAPIRVVDVFVPFVSAYRPIWLGLGALALDLLAALTVTSLLRHRIGYSGWRIVHWLAYVCWPVAILHGLGTGTDTRSGLFLALTVACIAAVLAAAVWRLVEGLAGRPALRGVGVLAVAVATLSFAGWLRSGPLASGWARRAGTPASLLASGSVSQASAVPTPAGSPTNVTTTTTTAPATGAIPMGGFTARFAGTLHQSAADARGESTLSLVGSLSDGASGVLDVELVGRPLAGGGVSIDHGTVTLTGGSGDRWTGSVTNLGGSRVYATVTGPGGAVLALGIEYSQLDQQAGRMSGVVTGAPPSTTSPQPGTGGRRSEGDDRE